MSVVLSFFYSFLDFSLKASVIGESMDEALLHGRFGIEYIKEELREADMIISSDLIPNLNSIYPDNIGFVLYNDNGIIGSDERYSFTTYYLANNNLVRIDRNQKISSYPDASKLSGYNEVCENVLSIADTEVNYEDKLISLSLSMGYDQKEFHNFKSCIYLDVEYDY